METITPEQMKIVEEESERIGIPRILLMENAGRGIADFLKPNKLDRKKVVILSGTGNNGGDGFVAARHLSAYQAIVVVVLLGKSESIKTDEASSNWRAIQNMARSILIHIASSKKEIESLSAMIKEADILIDGILGTGVKGEIREPYLSAIKFINESKAHRIAIDVPSGLDPFTGEVHSTAVRADTTITFHKMKVGLKGRNDVTGEIIVMPIGIPREANIS